MTNEKINEMWTKLNETKLTGKRAIDTFKKMLTNEERKAFAKEALEYYEANKADLNEKKYDKALNNIMIKLAAKHKVLDGKKLMAKIATFVERMVEENEIEMPEIVFDATSCKANKKQIKLAVIELLYKVNKDEEAIYKSICNWLVEVFGKFYGKEITADVDAIWNEVEETDEVEEEKKEEKTMEKQIRNYKTERTTNNDGDPIIVIHGRDYEYYSCPKFEIVAVKKDKTNRIPFIKDVGSSEWKTYGKGGLLKSLSDNAELCKRLSEILENFHLIRDGKPAIAC